METNNELEVHILNGCGAKNKDDLFNVLSAEAAGMKSATAARLSADAIRERLAARERENPTELGNGLFFPHARIKQLQGLTVVLAVPKSPLGPGGGFASPVRLVCMMLIPEEAPMEALKFMSCVAGCVQNHECHDHLCRILSEGNLPRLMGLLNLNAQKTLCANDLMRRWRCELAPGMKLQHATKLMLAEDVQIAPVLENGKLAGELSCTELFKLGIPDFFTQLKSVGFIRYFDPFENYFAKEAASLVSDVMTKTVSTFPPDSTLIEVVFAMAVKRIQLIYIVDADNRLLGIIDQTVLLERIINL